MKTDKLNVHAVLFDLDGTLADTEKMSVASWYYLGKKYGFRITERFIKKTRGHGSDIGRRIAFEEYGEDFPYDRYAKEQMKKREELILEAESLEIRGARKLLEELKRRNIPYTLVTSRQEEWGKYRLEKAHLDDLFGECIWREKVEKMKPDPEGLLKGAALLGIKPEHCLMVGDTMSDILAAKSAGISCAFVKGTIEADEEIAQSAYICECIEDVLELLPDQKG